MDVCRQAIIPEDEMRDLCYVLTCRSVQDAPSFRNWLGDVHRTQLLEQLETLLEFETPSSDLQAGRNPLSNRESARGH